MRTVIACCAVLTFAYCGPALSAPPSSALTPFDGYIMRPPASVPHGRGVRAAAAPLPRPKPVSAPRPAPAAPPSGSLVFPPVTPLE
jgi:hypothetical protein